MQLIEFLKPHKYFSCLLALVFVICGSLNSYAATTQGAPDYFASTGTVDINVTSGDLIRIFGLQTVSFGTWNIGDGNLASNQNVCIGKSSTGAPYAIQATGDGNLIDPSAFTLSNGVDQINYEVYWNDQTGTGGQVPLLPGSVQYGQTGPAVTFFRNLIFGGFFGFTCGSSLTPPNANLEVRIPSTELTAATGGIYTGVLTLLVIPN